MLIWRTLTRDELEHTCNPGLGIKTILTDVHFAIELAVCWRRCFFYRPVIFTSSSATRATQVGCLGSVILYREIRIT